jgi:hypothetical protein
MKKFTSMPSPTVGADPELFLTDTKGVPVAAETIYGALPKKGSTPPAIGYDNVAVEYTLSPTTCLQQNNERHQKQLLKIVQKAQDNGLRTSIAPALEFPVETLKKYKSASIFGCDPSMLCIDGEVMMGTPAPNPMEVKHRSAGFHIHIGVKATHSADAKFRAKMNRLKQVLQNDATRIEIVQSADLLLGLPSVILDQDPSNKIRRMELGYGLAGEFRYQPYGLEYRTLSAWPLTHPMWVWWATASLRDSVRLIFHDIKLFQKMDMVAVGEVINKCEVKEAAKLWTRLKKLLCKMAWQEMIPSKAGNTSCLMPEILMRVEFLMAAGGIKHTSLPQHSSISAAWADRAYGQGFPNTTESLTRSTDFASFKKKWSTTKDCISHGL